MYLSDKEKALQYSNGMVILRPRCNQKTRKFVITHYNGCRYNEYTWDKFETFEQCQKKINEMVEENPRKFMSDYYEESIADQAAGTCKKCGCTYDNACTHPDHGPCWWIDDNQDMCSHCYIEDIANDPATEHPAKQVTCVISDPGCVYHACMTDDCQKENVLSNGLNWGTGKCDLKATHQS